MIKALEDAGFTGINRERYNVKEDLEDLFLYSGKHLPEIYLIEGFPITLL